MTKVAELSELLAKRNESRYVTTLGQFRIADDCATVTIEGTNGGPNNQYILDEKATAVIAKYLKLPVKYLNECPPDFRSHTLKYWRDRRSQIETVVEAVDDQLVNMYSPGLMMLPVKAVAKMVERVFRPEDEIALLLRDEKKFHLDVTSDEYQVEVLNPNGIPGRPAVGDITVGGIRFLANPSKVEKPTVARYFRRLVCLNGMTVTETEGDISIKGLSVMEVLASMEEAADQLLGDMDDHLDRYKKTAELPVPGHPLSFAEQLGNELGVPQKALHTVLDRVRQLPEEGTTVYDVNQAFTSVANEVRTYDLRTQLQNIGGQLALHAERMIERCTTCERLLVE